MSAVTQLLVGKGSYLATVSLWRTPDGSVRAALEDMPDHVIEDRPTISQRFVALSEWCIESAASFLRQAIRFEDVFEDSEGALTSAEKKD